MALCNRFYPCCVDLSETFIGLANTSLTFNCVSYSFCNFFSISLRSFPIALYHNLVPDYNRYASEYNRNASELNNRLPEV